MTASQLTIGTFTRSLLVSVAEKSGKLARERLEVTEASVPSSPAQFASLESGEYDLVLTAPDNTLAYRFLESNPLGRNLPVEIIAAVDRGLGLSLWLSPATPGADSMRGRTLGVDVPQSGFSFIAYALLERAGLEPGEYEVASLGSTPGRAAALIKDECQATILNAGNEFRAMREGCAVIGRVSDYGPYLGSVLAALPTTDAEKRDARSRFAAVLHETSSELLAGQWKSEFLDSAQTLLGLSDDDAEAHYRVQLDPETGLVSGGRVDRESIATLVELRKKYMPAPELDSIMGRFDELVTYGE